jgi:hypothetical protein
VTPVETPPIVTTVPDALPVVIDVEQIPMEQHRFSLRTKLRSVFVVALVIFGLFNIYCSFFNPFDFDPFKYSYKGWAWWTMNDLKRTPNVHNVAVLGSSLMVSAVAGCDANHLKKSLDLTKYHHVSYLDDKLKQAFGGSFNTFNLSAPGQMPSDAYLSLRAMVATAARPDVVVYGIAPRDFVDSLLNGPNDTEPFKYLTRFVNIDEVATHEFRSAWAKLDWCLQRLVFLYGYSLDFRLAFGDTSTTLINHYLPKPWSSHPFTWWDRTRILPTYIPGEIHPEAVISTPLTSKDIKFTDNTDEYRRRYKQPDPDTFKTQMYFLRKLAEFCKRERIQLVLVNMPIMQCNIEMLDSKVYAQYLTELNKFAWNTDFIYCDLCDFTKYSKKDYHDTVHLNAFGGKKFFDELITSVVKDPRAANSLTLAGIQLERNTALATQLKLRRTY